jgi:hypothetical protein
MQVNYKRLYELKPKIQCMHTRLNIHDAYAHVLRVNLGYSPEISNTIALLATNIHKFGLLTRNIHKLNIVWHAANTISERFRSRT